MISTRLVVIFFPDDFRFLRDFFCKNIPNSNEFVSPGSLNIF